MAVVFLYYNFCQFLKKTSINKVFVFSVDVYG